MGLFDFIKHKELTEIAILRKELEIAKEKEESLSSEVIKLKSQCAELSKYEKIVEICFNLFYNDIKFLRRGDYK